MIFMKSAARTKNMILSGRVISGLGKGKYFMGLNGYKIQFIKKLGITPYPGTLNLKLSAKNVAKFYRIKRRKRFIVKGFRRGKKTYGDVYCYAAEISGMRCALIIPKLSTHSDVAEIISSKKLRTALKIRDGSRVRVLIL